MHMTWLNFDMIYYSIWFNVMVLQNILIDIGWFMLCVRYSMTKLAKPDHSFMGTSKINIWTLVDN